MACLGAVENHTLLTLALANHLLLHEPADHGVAVISLEFDVLQFGFLVAMNGGCALERPFDGAGDALLVEVGVQALHCSNPLLTHLLDTNMDFAGSWAWRTHRVGECCGSSAEVQKLVHLSLRWSYRALGWPVPNHLLVCTPALLALPVLATATAARAATLAGPVVANGLEEVSRVRANGRRTGVAIARRVAHNLVRAGSRRRRIRTTDLRARARRSRCVDLAEIIVQRKSVAARSATAAYLDGRNAAAGAATAPLGPTPLATDLRGRTQPLVAAVAVGAQGAGNGNTAGCCKRVADAELSVATAAAAALLSGPPVLTLLLVLDHLST